MTKFPLGCLSLQLVPFLFFRPCPSNILNPPLASSNLKVYLEDAYNLLLLTAPSLAELTPEASYSLIVGSLRLLTKLL